MIKAAIGRSFVLNVAAAAAGLGGTLFVTWYFGLAEFAYFTINTAKLSLILLGAELLPSSFTMFRLQEDARFTTAVPVFYCAFAIAATAIAAVLIGFGLVSHWSWFMLLFVFNSALQRYFDTQAQASGRVNAYFWIPATTNITRLALLAGLSQLRLLGVDDILWASTAIGGMAGQAMMISRFPEFLDRSVYRRPLGKIAYLWSLRGSYYGYYANSVLKRFRDTFLPLFCDLAIPSKAEIGRLLVFTRANEAVCGQVRVLEAFMVNRTIREGIREARRRIFWVIAPLGQIAVATVALILMYRHGIRPEDVVLALFTGFFLYPYILELFWRNDALASFHPRRVTISLATFLAVLIVPPVIAWATGTLSIPILIASYVLSQTFAALTYRLFRMRRLAPQESRAA
jgi:hypothetical protein